MKNFMRVVSFLIGCLFVALSFNLLILPNYLLSFGVHGIAALLFYKTGVNPGINILLINLIVLVISSLFLKRETIKMFLLPSIVIPLFVYLTTPFITLFPIVLPEMMLTIIVAGVLSGIGYSMIYKQGYSVGVSFLLEELIGNITRFYSKLYSWIIDVILFIIANAYFDYQTALYSLLIMFIAKYMITKARFGINDSKMFYIITSKEKEVRNFIIHDLKYTLSEMDVKGGFTKKHNKILLTVISTIDYYKLKEGIKIIDPNAFIAITDTYDVVNKKTF